jgi:hypothetical protein
MPRCEMCGGRAEEDDKCYGCGCFICENCDEELGILGKHRPEDHYLKATKLKESKNG